MQSAVSPHQYFSENYATARSRFLTAATSCEATVESATHPLSGPSGETLATDAALIGTNKENLLVMTSGTHGVELLSGSGCQSGHLETGRFDSVLESCSVLLLHALNPWGAAYKRRNTEENVDLCRNFMDFSNSLPENPAYENPHRSIQSASIADVDTLVREGFSTLGTRDFMNTLMSGQYVHGDGFSFGGQEPTWANQTVTSLLSHFAEGFQRVIIVDYHSGVGPYGYGSAVCMQEDLALEKTQRMFGHWVIAPREKPKDGPSNFYTVFGHAADGYKAALPGVDLSTIVLEFGTFASESMLTAMLTEHVARFGRDTDESTIHSSAANVEALHHPSDKEWLRAVWDRSNQVIDQAVAGFNL